MQGQRQWTVVLAALVAASGLAAAGHAQSAGVSGAPAVPRIGQAEFRMLHGSGAVLAVDVRGEAAYRAGHIPGAMHVPLASTAASAEAIRTRAAGRTIVTYCSCPAEQTSAEAAAVLLEQGVGPAGALVGGYVQWVRDGGPVEAGGAYRPAVCSAASAARKAAKSASDSTVTTPRIW